MQTSESLADIRELREEYETLGKAPNGKGGQKEFIQKRHKVKAIVFFDEQGHKIKEVQFPEDDKEGRIKKTTKFVYNKSKKNIVITNKEHHWLKIEEYRNTGEIFKVNNSMTYYDEKGNELFRRDKLDFEAVNISENGETIVALKLGPELLEYVSQGVRQNPPKAKLYVLSKKGETILELEERHIYPDNILISPTGKWVLFYSSPKFQFKLVRVTSGESMIIPGEKIWGEENRQPIRIRDDGRIILNNYVGMSKEGKRTFKFDAYYPMEDSFRNLGLKYYVD